MGQKVLYKNPRQDLSKNQNLQQRRLRSFTVTKRVTNTIYQIQDDRVPTILKTVHRNHLVEDYPKKETLPPMIEEYVPMDRRPDDFYEIHGATNSEDKQPQTLWHRRLSAISY